MKGYRRILIGISVLALLVGFSSSALWGQQEHPGEHPGKKAQEHPGEHPGKKAGEAEPVSADVIRQGINSHILAVLAKNDNLFPIRDDKTQKDLKLQFVRVHDRVSIIKGKTYFACSDFTDTASSDTYDLDFWMKREDGEMKVVETKIHKVNGVPRFTYDKDKPVEVK
jgi:hypothetical protein